MNFGEKLIRAKNEIKIRVLTQRVYDATDRMIELGKTIEELKKQ